MGAVRLLLISGAPATGKTTLARELARRLAVPVIAKDTIKEALLDRIGAPDPQRSRILSDASFAVLFALAQAQLAAAVSVLLEGNFRVPEHNAAVRALLEPGAGIQVRFAQVLCELPEDVRRERLRARAQDPSRHAGHRDDELAAGPSPPQAAWLAPPGERFAYEGKSQGGSATVLAALERWWRSA